MVQRKQDEGLDELRLDGGGADGHDGFAGEDGCAFGNRPDITREAEGLEIAEKILGKETLFVDGKEGIRGVELMNAIELSGWNNAEEIAIPIDEERYLAELNARRAVSRLKDTVDGAAANTAGTY